ncbi:MAG TPA: AzlD domain-containing protein [Usitatibacteraceae bacterium]|nr:AzlD domain-containing protein [Usitatibacteraceae bacterium]
MNAWTVIIGAGIVALLLRASFIVFADPHKFPHGFRVALGYVPPAVLAAIVVPGLAMPHGELDLSLANPRLLAGVAAFAIAARYRGTLAPIAIGMVVLWVLQAALG